MSGESRIESKGCVWAVDGGVGCGGQVVLGSGGELGKGVEYEAAVIVLVTVPVVLLTHGDHRIRCQDTMLAVHISSERQELEREVPSVHYSSI